MVLITLRSVSACVSEILNVLRRALSAIYTSCGRDLSAGLLQMRGDGPLKTFGGQRADVEILMRGGRRGSRVVVPASLGFVNHRQRI